jgi:hypothetical protein
MRSVLLYANGWSTLGHRQGGAILPDMMRWL